MTTTRPISTGHQPMRHQCFIQKSDMFHPQVETLQPLKTHARALRIHCQPASFLRMQANH